MSFNGSGTFQINTTGQPVVATTTIAASVFNAFTADVATGLSTCLTKDGQTTVTADIPLNNNKLTGVKAATARTDAASLATIQDGTGVYVATVGGTADAITLTPTPAITAYATGQEFWWLASGANTGAVTLQISGLASPKAVKKYGTTALAAGDIASGAITSARYDGTNFQLTSRSNTLNSPTLVTPTVTGLLDASAASAGQIKFPASQNASADANTLDDYEEGTWTPVLTFATPGNLNVVYSVQVGTYTKIGRSVHLSFCLTTSTFTHTTASGDCQITGLPFTSLTLSGVSWVGAVIWQGITKAGFTDLNVQIGSNAALANLLISGSAQNVAVLAPADTPTGGTMVLRGTVTYSV